MPEKNQQEATELGAGPKRVMQLLKQLGPSTAESLAEPLAVTGTAIRQHLYTLRDQGLVASRDEPRPMGRPAKIWELTQAAAVHFPQNGSPLVESLLRSAQEALGATRMEAAMCGCVDDQVARYRKGLSGKRTLSARLKALVAMRDADGYLAQLERQADGSFVLYENHCPISGAVASCAQLCDAELLIFQQLFTGEADVERLEHMGGGDRRCSYRISCR